jgi:hypothetical protein
VANISIVDVSIANVSIVNVSIANVSRANVSVANAAGLYPPAAIAQTVLRLCDPFVAEAVDFGFRTSYGHVGPA